MFEGKSAPLCYDSAQTALEQSKLVVINGVSKTYVMTEFRIGWAIANGELTSTMENIQSQQTSDPSAPSQWAAVGALNGVQASVEALRLTLENRCDVAREGLEAMPGMKVTKPEGTFYCFPDFSAYMRDWEELANFPVPKMQVVAVPGKEFGFEGHLRLSYCSAMKDITEGLERIQWVLDPDSANEFYLGDRKLVRDWP